MIYRLLFLLAVCTTVSSALKCLQCDRNDGWFDPEMNKKKAEICNLGLMEPTHCSNKTHTHCIVDSFRSGDNPRVITSRRCGTLDDISGCTLYNTVKSGGDEKTRKMRHLITTDGSAKKPARRTVPNFVEVCSTACPDGACINSSSSLSLFLLLIITAYRSLN